MQAESLEMELPVTGKRQHYSQLCREMGQVVANQQSACTCMQSFAGHIANTHALNASKDNSLIT